MQQKPEWLLDYATPTHSQAGEDGVAAKILSVIGEQDRWCVEFGADDGMRGSNTRRLIDEDGYQAILIEGDPARYAALQRNCAGHQRITTLNTYVGFGQADSLDRILSRFPIPERFDFLSIDIDGNDYHVWAAVEAYRPKVVCIEFNPTIPTEVSFAQTADMSVHQGASVLALTELGRRKGYELVCVLPFNAIFVDECYFPRLGIADNAPHTLRKNVDEVTWLFSGYDGSIHLAGRKMVPWQSFPIDERCVQVMPRFLRVYPECYTRIQSLLIRILRRYRRTRREAERP